MNNFKYYIVIIGFVLSFIIGRVSKQCNDVDIQPIIYTDSAQLDYLHKNIDGLTTINDSLKQVISIEKKKRQDIKIYYEKIINGIDTISESELQQFFTDRYGD